MMLDRQLLIGLEQKNYFSLAWNKFVSTDKFRDYMQYLFTLGEKINATIILMMAVHQEIFIYNIYTYLSICIYMNIQTYTHS